MHRLLLEQLSCLMSRLKLRTMLSVQNRVPENQCHSVSTPKQKLCLWQPSKHLCNLLLLRPVRNTAGVFCSVHAQGPAKSLSGTAALSGILIATPSLSDCRAWCCTAYVCVATSVVQAKRAKQEVMEEARSPS